MEKIDSGKASAAGERSAATASARIRTLVGEITPCRVFADIGCDHGYAAQLVLNKRLAKRLYITDISEKSLAKARELLKDAVGKNVFPLCCDGFSAIPEPVDQALIAGMGGEEIIKIIDSANPPRLVLQPMKNTEKLRRFLVRTGYRLLRDLTFADCGKFYDLIVAVCGEDELSGEEYEFGRDNVRDFPPAFREKMRITHDELAKCLEKPMSEKSHLSLVTRLKKTEKYL